MCGLLAACPSPLLCTQLCSNFHTMDVLQAVWRAEGGAAPVHCWGVRATDTSVKQLWCRAMEQPQGDATFQDSIADMAPEYPRREKTLGCLGHALHCTALPTGPVGSLSQAEARKWECSESKALLLFVCFSTLCSGNV